jgi:hypothetical protein
MKGEEKIAEEKYIRWRMVLQAGGGGESKRRKRINPGVRGAKFGGERGRNPVIREDKIQWGVRERFSVQRGMKSISERGRNTVVKEGEIE